MRLWVLASVLFTGTRAAMPWPSSAHGTGRACLRYKPDTVAVAGVLTRKTFPGRPNYESVKEGDEPETAFYLEVGVPLCTIASPDSADDNNVSLHVPTVLIPAFIASAYLSLKALNEIEKGSDTFSVIVLGLLAGDEHFTPKGRQFRLWSIAVLGSAILVVVLVYLVTSMK
jgi:hypothetical protein